MKSILATASALALTVGLFVSAPAHAGVTNDSISGAYEAPLGTVITNLGTNTVVPPATFTDPGFFQFVITDTQLIATALNFSNYGSDPFNGYVFGELSQTWGPVTINSVTGASGFNVADLTVSGNQLDLNFRTLFFSTGDQIVLDLNTGVPEPASMALLGAGLLGIGMVRRKRA